MHPATLRSADAGLETVFRAHLLRSVIPSTRVAHGIVTWAAARLVRARVTADDAGALATGR